MIARTVKGPVFTIVVDGKAIVVQHVSAKGRRCRVTAPNGVQILSGFPESNRDRPEEGTPSNECPPEESLLGDDATA